MRVGLSFPGVRADLTIGALLFVLLPAGTWLSYRLGGEPGLLWFGDIASLIVASFAAVMFVKRLAAGERKECAVWLLLAVCFGLWAIAEGIWGYYELVMNVTVPFPSLADAIWLFAYLPLIAALLLRYRLSRIRLDSYQLAALLCVFLATLGTLFFFVVLPILLAPAGGRPLEKALNLLYPCMDLIVLTFLILAVLSLRGEANAFGWQIILAGIILMATIDLLFSYATWNELYHAAPALNRITFVIDAGYPLSYLLIALGVRIDHRLQRAP